MTDGFSGMAGGVVMSISSFGLTRRQFVVGAAGTTLLLSLEEASAQGLGALSAVHGRSIQKFRVGSPTTVPNNFGDTWVTAWADDDSLYSPSDDTLGFDIPEFFTEDQIKLFQSDFDGFAKQLTAEEKNQFRYSPIAFNRIEGNDPLQLRGTTVNRMQDYVIQDGYRAMLDGPGKGAADHRTWKSSGCAFFDGALYWVIARDGFPDKPNGTGLRQTAADASIIKSMDYGKTWTRSQQEISIRRCFRGRILRRHIS